MKRYSLTPFNGSYSRWNDSPFLAINSLLSDVGHIFDGEFSKSTKKSSSYETFVPKTLIKDRSDSIEFTLEVPGLSEDDFQIKFKDNKLTVTGDKKTSHNEEKDSITYSEIGYGKFERSYMLDAKNFDSENIKASLKNGLLTINVPKVKKEEEEKIIPLS